jgi:hypothetical protein
LGDPWTGRTGCPHGLEFGLFCSCLADSLPIARGRSAWRQLDWCSSCSSLVLERLPFDLLFQPSSVAGGLANGPPAVRGQSVRSVLVADEVPPRTVRYCWCSTGGLRVIFGRSTATSRTVRRGLADSPPGARGQSAWYCAGLLSPLLLDSCFRFGIVWGLFQGLVGPL